MLKQQTVEFIFGRPRKTNVHFSFPLAANKQKFAVSIFRLQKTSGSCRFPLAPYSGNVKIWRHETDNGKHKTEA
jgi:hypothetical protein